MNHLGAMVRPWLVAMPLRLLMACSGAQTITADPSDYELYRRTRVARTSEERLTASFAYLEKSPDGRWREEVEEWFERAEPEFFKKSQESLGKLEGYLETLPRGPHAQKVAERISELQAVVREERQRDARLSEEAAQVEGKLSDAEKMRRALVYEVADWSARLAAIRSWGQPTSELHHETIHRFRVEPPAARCADERCIKRMQMPFAIPDGGKLGPRKAILDVELGLYRGGVVLAKLGGPELWSRVAEASEVRPVHAGDAQARTEAIARAVQIVEGALGPELSAAGCVRPAVSPTVLARECRGVRITMVAAPDAESDDQLVVEPLPGIR